MQKHPQSAPPSPWLPTRQPWIPNHTHFLSSLNKTKWNWEKLYTWQSQTRARAHTHTLARTHTLTHTNTHTHTRDAPGPPPFPESPWPLKAQIFPPFPARSGIDLQRQLSWDSLAPEHHLQKKMQIKWGKNRSSKQLEWLRWLTIIVVNSYWLLL
jgi:hypothetical protein